MSDLIVYFAFAGNCEEAMNFYKEVFGGEFTSKMTFAESPMPVPDEYKSKLMHIGLKTPAFTLMASDTMPDQPCIIGNNISLTFSLSSEAEQDSFFEKLSVGGNITMPLQNTFWGARFGMITDKFGINWMLNYEAKKD